MRPLTHLALAGDMTEQWDVRDALAWVEETTALSKELEDIDRMAERTAKGGRKDGAR